MVDSTLTIVSLMDLFSKNCLSANSSSVKFAANFSRKPRSGRGYKSMSVSMCGIVFSAQNKPFRLRIFTNGNELAAAGNDEVALKNYNIFTLIKKKKFPFYNLK